MTHPILKLLLPSVEDSLIKISNDSVPQEDKTLVVKKNAERIREFLDATDATPTRTQVLTRCEKKLRGLSELAYSGKKPTIGLRYSDSCQDYPISLVFRMFETMTESILVDLGSKDIHPSKLKKPTGYRGYRKSGSWTVEEIKNLPLDWCASAVVAYYHAQQESDPAKKCEGSAGILTTDEFHYCLDMLERGYIETLFDDNDDDEDSWDWDEEEDESMPKQNK